MSVPADGSDEVTHAAGLVSRLVQRAALDGSTVVPADVVAAALRGVGVHDPAPGARRALESGDVAACAEDRMFGHPQWAEAEERVAEDVVRLVTAAGDQALLVVDAPRGSAPASVTGPLVEAVESAAGTVAHVRGDDTGERLPGLAGADLVVVDRADLLGLSDAAGLLGSLRDGARLVLVGDPALPPAPGPGQVLADVAASGVVPVLPAPDADDDADELVRLVRGLRRGELPVPDPSRREVVVTPVTDAEQAVRRAVQVVTVSVPRVFGTAGHDTADTVDTVVVAPRADGATGAVALREAMAAADASGVTVLTATEAVGRQARAVVLVLGAEAAGSLARDLLVGAATEAQAHLSVVHQAGPALAAAVARHPHRPRRTRLARLLADALA